jgi:hypothetical protein
MGVAYQNGSGVFQFLNFHKSFYNSRGSLDIFFENWYNTEALPGGDGVLCAMEA